MRIIFMGTPDFAEKSLEAIYNAKHEIIAVVTNPDRPKGRGMKMVASPVKEFAVSKNLTIYQPEKIRKNEEFIPQEIAKKLNIYNAYSEIYLEICNRVKEHPCNASIDDLHMPYFNYERDMLIDTMMQYGYSKKEAYEWCYNEKKLWETTIYD